MSSKQIRARSTGIGLPRNTQATLSSITVGSGINRFIQGFRRKRSWSSNQQELEGNRVVILALSADEEDSLAATVRLVSGEVAEFISLPVPYSSATSDRDAKASQATPAETSRNILNSRIRQFDTVIVTSTTNVDTSVVREVLFQLRDSCRTILKLTTDQIMSQATCYEMMQIATVTVLTEFEALALTSQVQISRSMEEFQKHQVGNVVITCQRASHACLDGNYYVLPSFAVSSVKCTNGTDEAFVTTFAASMSRRRNGHQCPRSAQKAMPDFIEGSETKTTSETTMWSVYPPTALVASSDSRRPASWSAILLFLPILTASVFLVVDAVMFM